MKRAAMLMVVIAILAFARAPFARAEELGRLFLTPEQRSALDARRKARLPDTPQAVIVESAATTRIDGYVKRGNESSTVWVNGQAQAGGAQQEGLRVLPRRTDPSRVTVEIGDGERSIDLKIGQSVDRATGAVRDPLRGGKAAPYVPPQRSR
jgi:hypothetical protein